MKFKIQTIKKITQKWCKKLIFRWSLQYHYQDKSRYRLFTSLLCYSFDGLNFKLRKMHLLGICFVLYILKIIFYRRKYLFANKPILSTIFPLSVANKNNRFLIPKFQTGLSQFIYGRQICDEQNFFIIEHPAFKKRKTSIFQFSNWFQIS